MAYVPTVWTTGDVITAEKLNKAENGIASATGLFVTVTFDGEANRFTFDKTWKEVTDKIKAGGSVIAVYEEPEGIFSIFQILTFGTAYGSYIIDAESNGQSYSFVTDSETGYPVGSGTQ